MLARNTWRLRWHTAQKGYLRLRLHPRARRAAASVTLWASQRAWCALYCLFRESLLALTLDACMRVLCVQAVSHRGYFIPPRPEKKLEGQLDARCATQLCVRRAVP